MTTSTNGEPLATAWPDVDTAVYVAFQPWSGWEAIHIDALGTILTNGPTRAETCARMAVELLLSSGVSRGVVSPPDEADP